MSQRILVVDDDELICDLVSETLGFEGYEVEAAYSGAQALQVLADTPADLVLLDIVMAGMDGLEVYRQLLQDARLRDIPVIFFTAGDQPGEVWQDADERVFDVVQKPFHPLSLAPKIRATLARSHVDAVRRRRRQEQLLGRSQRDTAQPMDGVGGVR